MPGATGSAKEFQVVAAWIGGIFTGAVGCDRGWTLDGWRRVVLGRCRESRGAPRDSTSTPHRSRILFLISLISKVGRGRNESGTTHRAALICTSSRFTSTFPRSGPIHASGFPAASRVVTIPFVFIGPHEPGMKSSPHPGLPPLGKGSNVQDDCPRPALSSTQIVLHQPIIPSGVRPSFRDPSPERPSGPSFAETLALSSLWPIALATPDSSPRPAMYAADELCRCTMHRVPASPATRLKFIAPPYRVT
jgi:hypothetical protein